MKLLIQRVTKAFVTVENTTIGAIDKGFLVFIGVTKEDTVKEADRLVKKMIGLRIFQDENGKTNLALKDVGGELLLVSQFTLYANCEKGNRPSFIDAANPVLAEELYNYIIKKCQEEISVVQTGCFGASMNVTLENDGPFTIMLE